jgi:hypothetical protein
VISPTEALYDPIMEAGRARMGDESIPSNVRLREPLALLILLSPSPFREVEADLQDADQNPGDAP